MATFQTVVGKYWLFLINLVAVVESVNLDKARNSIFPLNFLILSMGAVKVNFTCYTRTI